ncbi:MAG TPA: hypothetical protein VFK58_07990 [Sphingomicrobium sp.]|nr:hypothetical protein [Sphingomicrobium sp.]
MIAAAPPRPSGPRPWWETRAFVAALILLSMAPLIYPPIPPLVDLLGHMGRYRVQLDVAASPWLPLYYGFEWAPIGNLGVDILVQLIAPWLGLEPAVKLITLSIPPLTVAGFLWVAREVHNRLPPTALFALPLVYSQPFVFGFLNFALAMALAFLAFGLWLRLGRLGRTGQRAALFVPVSVILFFTHTFGWGLLGLLAFSAEAVRQHDRGAGWLRSALKAGLHASSMALPLLLVLAWRVETPGGMTSDWFNFDAKWAWIQGIFRERWKDWDIASLAIVALVLAEAVRNRRLGFSRNLAFSALVLAAVYVLLPRIIFGSAYADMRLAPFVVAVALLAIRFRADTHLRTAQLLALLGLAFYVARLATTTVSFWTASDDQRAKLAALEHVPMGARVVNFVGQGCIDYWAMPFNSHLGAMVIVRRHGFSNDQWTVPGSNLLTVRYARPGAYSADPSEIVRPVTCRRRGAWRVNEALSNFPRDAFDYAWLIDVPPFDPRAIEDLEPVWSGARSTLYRIRPAGEAPRPATPRTASEPGRSAPPRARTGP